MAAQSSIGQHGGNGGRGVLIVIEGLDRAGKSSQCERLFHTLVESGHQARYIRFPGSLQVVY
jgi:thymidylate kinase